MSFFTQATLLVMVTLLTYVSSTEKMSLMTYSLLQGYVPNSQIRCGGTLAGQQGVISHKFDANNRAFQPNERCVWIIRAAQATSYSVTSIVHGAPGSLVVSGLGLTSLRSFSLPRGTGTATIANSNVLVVTFHTGPSNTTYPGFALSWTAITTGTNIKAIGNSSTDVIVGSDFNTVRHPKIRTQQYGNRDLSVFVFTPANNILVPGQEIRVFFQELGLEACCDTLSVYGFDPNPRTGYNWVSLGSIVGNGNRTVEFSRNDTIMIVFQTDSSVVRDGFMLTSSQSNCSRSN